MSRAQPRCQAAATGSDKIGAYFLSVVSLISFSNERPTSVVDSAVSVIGGTSSGWMVREEQVSLAKYVRHPNEAYRYSIAT